MEKVIYDVLDKIEKNGYEAYIVGGFVREYILKKNSYDIDITTSAKPKDIVDLFKDYDVKLYDYGNVSFNIEKYKFDITTYRKDLKYKNNRKPEKIVYIDSLEEDLKRRDFTINTICMDKDENIIDYYDGKKDIKRKLIRSIGNPNEKIKEDALRILRAVRFATTYKYTIDKELKEAIIENRNLLENISYERKKEELNKIFCSKYKKYRIKLLSNLKLKCPLEINSLDNALLNNDLTGIWATITDVNYAFTKKEKEIITKIKELEKEDINDKYIEYKYGLYPLTIVSNLKKLNTKKITAKYDALPIKDKNEINITTDEICDLLNKEPGEFIKNIFENLEKSILNDELKNEKGEIKEYIINKYKED